MYNFDILTDRTGTDCVKWERRTEDEKKRGIIAMSVADMEFAVAPCVREAVVRAAEHGVYGYTDPYDDYYQSVCDWMKTRHAWSVTREEMVPIHGVVPAIAICVRAYTKPGDGVIVQSPVYPPFYMMVKFNGRELIENPLINENGHYRMDFDDLDKKCEKAKLLVLCSPHNPVGRVWTEAELKTLHEICARHNVMVVSDEIHFDLTRFGGHTPFQKLDSDSVVMTAPSKTFNIPGLQIANIFIKNPELRKKFSSELLSAGGSNISYFGCAAARAAYTGGADWLDAAREYIYGNFDMTRDFIARRFPKAVVTPIEGTYLMWIDFRFLGLGEGELEDFMRKESGLILDEGYIFGSYGSGFERINIALPRPVLKEALDRLAAAADKRGF